MSTKLKWLTYKSECELTLFQCDIGVLRAYARYLGVEKPTTKKKMQLVQDVVSILLGETNPIEKSKRGAPVKNNHVDTGLLIKMDEIRRSHLGEDPIELPPHLRKPGALSYDPLKALDSEGIEGLGSQANLDYYEGQLQTLGGVACLLPLSCRESDSQNVIVPVDLIRRYELREGDVLYCRTRRMENNKGWVVFQVQYRNGVEITGDESKRACLEEGEVALATKEISFYKGEGKKDVALKALEWLLPIRRGQRACIVGTPKSGKTHLLFETAKSALENNPDLLTYVLLIEQTPETVMRFREIMPRKQIVYTTYEDDAEKQVFTADFLLKRVVRQVESGKDVLLIVDSFNTLAAAFNNTEESSGGKVLAGGLESKTVQYLKRFFGTARALKKGKSLTIIGALSKETGNIADDILCADLSKVANLEIHLSDELAIKRVYPAIDFTKTRFSDGALTESQNNFDNFLRNEFLPSYGNEGVLKQLKASPTLELLRENMKNK